jgi:TetR/AcrR family transcriptional regulator, acrAB operon repressor
MVRRTKEEAQETRSQILEAAEKAFYERGVARTTLADIATLAGVTRGAIYWHFSNKADVVQAMLDTLHEPLDDMARASESEEELDPLGCMRQLLIHLFHQIALDPKTRRLNEILFHKCEFTVQPSACMPTSMASCISGCWLRTALSCMPRPSAGPIQGWTCCASAPACAN